jgi:hypothetical protein
MQNLCPNQNYQKIRLKKEHFYYRTVQLVVMHLNLNSAVGSDEEPQDRD